MGEFYEPFPDQILKVFSQSFMDTWRGIIQVTVAVPAQTTHPTRRQTQVIGIQDHFIRMCDSEQDLDHHEWREREDSSVMECVGGEGIFMRKRENGYDSEWI